MNAWAAHTFEGTFSAFASSFFSLRCFPRTSSIGEGNKKKNIYVMHVYIYVYIYVYILCISLCQDLGSKGKHHPHEVAGPLLGPWGAPWGPLRV